MLYLLKKDDEYLGINGLTMNMTEVFVVSFDYGQIYIPTYRKYLVYDGDTVSFSDKPVHWDVTASGILVTSSLKILTYADKLVLLQTSSEWINFVTGIRLFSPISVVENLIVNGMVLLPCFVDKELYEQLYNSPHERVSDLLGRDPRFATVLANERLQNLLQDLFGPEYHLTTYSSNKLLKNVDHRSWHVDYPYHNLTYPFTTQLPALWISLQVIIPLNDFTEENGSTMYVPNSHHLMCWPEPDHNYKLLTIPKGMMAIYIGSMWHSQGLNTTNIPRIALLANFSPNYVPAKDNIAEQIERIPAKIFETRNGLVRFRHNI